MKLAYELRLDMRAIDQREGSNTLGLPLKYGKVSTTIRTETLDMALLPLLTKEPNSFHIRSASNNNLTQYIDKASVYKIGDPKPIASLFAFDTVTRKNHKPTDKEAEIIYFVKGKFDAASEKLQNIYRMFIQPGTTSGIPIGRYSYPLEQMRIADPTTFDLSSAMLKNILKTGNHYDVFKWEETPPGKSKDSPTLVNETISRIEGLVPAFSELVKTRIAPDGSYKMPSNDTVLTGTFLERTNDQKMVFTIHVQDYVNDPHTRTPGLYIVSPNPSVAADLVRKAPALKYIIKDAWTFSPIALSDSNSFDNVKAVPELLRLLKSENVIISKLATIANKRPLFKSDEIKPGIHR